MSEPLVSIIITTYNHEKYIRDAIEGCIEQKTDFPFEIIIHDDASSDLTAEIISKYSDAYPDLIFTILQKENQLSKGVKFFPKNLIPLAKGKYIARCEGDDYWIDPYKLQKQIEIMENDPSISLCFTATKWVYVDGSKKDKITRYYPKNHYLSAQEVIMKAGGVTDIVSTIFQKKIFDNTPDWYYLAPVGDIALYLLSLIHGKLFYLDEITSIYRKGVKGSWTTKNKSNAQSQQNFLLNSIYFRDCFDIYTEFHFHSYISKMNSLDIIDLSFIYKDYSEYKKIYFPRLTFFEKIEYYLFGKLGSRLLWHRYHKILRILGGN